MNDQIKVSLFKKPGSKIFHMQYRDPVTGNKRRKSTGTTIKRDAERIAGKWETDIKAGRDQSLGNLQWESFRDRFEQQHLPSLKKTTERKYIGILNTMETFRKPRQIRHVTTEFLTQYQQYLRKEGRAEATIKGHLQHIRSALQWGVDNGYLEKAPKLPRIKRAKAQKMMKGRPILLEEFERMLAATSKVILTPNTSTSNKEREPDVERIPSWKFLLRGLWLSGLRLGEAMDLHWTDNNCIRVDLSGKHPMFKIPGDKEKGATDRTLAMTPDFAELLLAVPKGERNGFVFNPAPMNRSGPRLTSYSVGQRISEIGEAAGVIVATKSDKVSYASAHDLRRSFGTRWATKVMPVVLQELMRHSSIATTLRFYVASNAAKTAADLWNSHANRPISESSSVCEFRGQR